MDKRWIVLAVLFVVRAVTGFQFQSVGSVGPLLSAHFHVGFAEVGALIGAYLLPGVFVAMPGGLLSSRWGDRAICVIGLALMAGGGLMLGEAGTMPVAFTARMASGVGATLMSLVLTKMVTDWFAGREIVLAMALILMSWPFGAMVGVLTQAAMAASFGWPTVMMTTAALSVASLLLLMMTDTGAGTRPAVPPPAFSLPARASLLPVSIAGIMWGAMNLGPVLFFSFAPSLLIERNFSQTAASSLTSAALWIAILSIPTGGYVVQRSGRPMLAIVTCALVSSVALLLIALDAQLAAACLLFGVAVGPMAGALLALPAEVLMPGDRASGFGIFYTWYYVLMATGPAIAGGLQDVWGTASAAMVTGASFLIAILPLLAVFAWLKQPLDTPHAVAAK